MKGVEMPINILVIVILAIIVLAALIIIFSGTWGQSGNTINIESAKSNACQILVSLGCDSDPEDIPVNNFDANGDGKKSVTLGDNLKELCKKFYGINDDPSACRKICGCIA